MLITAEDGGIVNDPVLLRVEENRWWLALADSRRRAVGARRRDPRRAWTSRSASPRSTRSRSRARSRRTSCGRCSAPAIDDIKYYWTLTTEVDGIPVVISRTGWTGEVGYEIYLRDPSRGGDLWDRIMEAGKPHKIRPIAPCEARRIEAGIFNYGSDMTIDDTPVPRHGPGAARRAAGRRLHRQGGARGDPRRRASTASSSASRSTATRSRSSCRASATRCHDGEPVGTVTDLIWSPRLEKNIGYVWVPDRSRRPGQRRSRSSRPTAASGRRGPRRSRSSTRRRPSRSAEPDCPDSPASAPEVPPVTARHGARRRSPPTRSPPSASQYRAASLLPGAGLPRPGDLRLRARATWFRRDWVVVGREEDAAATRDLLPGRASTARPLIVVRGRDGVLRAFYNVCRHRGTAVVEERVRQGRPLPVPVPRLDLRPRRARSSGPSTPRTSTTSASRGSGWRRSGSRPGRASCSSTSTRRRRRSRD